MCDVFTKRDNIIFLDDLEHSFDGLFRLFRVNEFLHKLIVVSKKVDNDGEFFLMEVFGDDTFSHSSTEIENIVSYLKTDADIIHDFVEEF